MGYRINWDNNDRTVVLQEYTETPTKNDLYKLARRSNQMLQSVDHRVHLIVDETKINWTLNATDLKFLERHVPPNQGVVVVIVANANLAYKKVMQNVGRAIAPKAYDAPHFVESLVEARQFLSENHDVVYP